MFFFQQLKISIYKWTQKKDIDAKAKNTLVFSVVY